MRKLIACAVILLLASVTAFADISYRNWRLDRALYLQHPPKLIVAGEIKEIKKGPYRSDRALSFEVERVILGDPGLAHTRISVPTGSFDWPEDLVPHKIGSFCILVLDRDSLYTVAPSSKGRTRTAVDQVDAIQVLEEEILLALKSETSPNRQVAILRQLAPILRKENISTVIPFGDASDLWLKRAALAALIYATEHPNYIGIVASDIKSFFSEESPTKCLKQAQFPLSVSLLEDSWRIIFSSRTVVGNGEVVGRKKRVPRTSEFGRRFCPPERYLVRWQRS